jgi:hypothetical protein
MSIRFLANNTVDAAVITASTENAQYPASNIQDDRRTKSFRSTSNTDNLVFDLGSSQAVDHFAIVANWQNGFGVSTLTLEGNATDSWGSPAFTTTITMDTTFDVGIKSFTSESHRFWRLVMTSTLGYCEVSNIFIGTADQVTTNGVGYGWAYTNKDLKRTSTNRYGQEFIDDITTRKELNNLKFQIMDKTEVDTIFNAYDNVRTVKPVYVYFPLETDSLFNNDDRFNGMYRFTGAPNMENVNSGFYNFALSVKECK